MGARQMNLTQNSVELLVAGGKLQCAKNRSAPDRGNSRGEMNGIASARGDMELHARPRRAGIFKNVHGRADISMPLGKGGSPIFRARNRTIRPEWDSSFFAPSRELSDPDAEISRVQTHGGRKMEITSTLP